VKGASGIFAIYFDVLIDWIDIPMRGLTHILFCM